MSTNYYKVWMGHELARFGHRFYKDDLWALYNVETGARVALVSREGLLLVADRDNKAAHRAHVNGIPRITVYATGPDDEWAISEYGEPVTLGDLRRGVAP